MSTGNDNGDSDAQALELVFVYGSLKRGRSNHRQLAAAGFCGDAQLPGLHLYDLGPFPMAVNSSDPQASLQGELYALEPGQLAALDRFEGAPRLYERQRHQLGDGRPVWVYVGRERQVRHVQRIASGCWLALLACLPLAAAAVQAEDLRHDCLAWGRSSGTEQVRLGNRIGQAQLLTKSRPFAEDQPPGSTALYSWADIQRLCRRL